MNIFSRHRHASGMPSAPSAEQGRHFAGDRSLWGDRSRWPALSVIALLFLGAIVIGALIVVAAREQDRLATDKSMELAHNVLASRQAELGRLTRDYAYWDDALENLDVAPNPEWATENIGPYLVDAFGVSNSLVLDAANVPILSFVQGEQTPIENLAGYAGGLDQLVAAARHMPLDGLATPTALLSVDGAIHLVAIAPISSGDPSSWPADRDLATRAVLIVSQVMDADLLTPLGEQYGLDGLTFVPADGVPHRSSIALFSPDGAMLGYLDWQSETPGIAMIRTLALPALMAFGVMAILALWIIWHMDSARRAILSNLDIIAQKNRELTTARDQAELANRTKTEFLANVSHELGTPVYCDYAHDIHQSGTLLLELITYILDMSKIESGKLELREETINPAELSNSAMRMIRDRAEAAGLTVLFESAGDLPELRADPRALKQILLNLLSNAVKFTPNGGKVVLRVAQAPDNSILFTVRDTGIGIAAEDLPQAMAVFGQIDGTLNRKHAGAGLGLPISRALAELHGGHLDLTSEPGVGTTVTVLLPSDRIAA